MRHKDACEEIIPIRFSVIKGFQVFRRHTKKSFMHPNALERRGAKRKRGIDEEGREKLERQREASSCSVLSLSPYFIRYEKK